jgi:hypothetical protein
MIFDHFLKTIKKSFNILKSGVNIAWNVGSAARGLFGKIPILGSVLRRSIDTAANLPVLGVSFRNVHDLVN